MNEQGAALGRLACPTHRVPLISQADALICPGGEAFPVIHGVPRFVRPDPSVTSFGDEWNFFNFTGFKRNWLEYYVANTFGSPAAFSGKDILDCGAGSGAASRWMADYGARHVWALELSHSVDGVLADNLRDVPNAHIAQCDIAHPPFAPHDGGDLVICHNVIQHTRSVEATARALWEIVRPGGEFVLTCYTANDRPGALRWLRWQVFRCLCGILRRAPSRVVWGYAWLMSHLVPIPVLGPALTVSYLARCGHVPDGPDRHQRMVKQTYLCTYDMIAPATYQHYPPPRTFQALIQSLQPDLTKVLHYDRYFQRPHLVGLALRIQKDARVSSEGGTDRV